MRTIDCKGLACPAPVLKAKELIEEEEPESLKILVDNEAAKENVSRFIQSKKYSVSVQEGEKVFHVIGKRDKTAECEPGISSKQVPEEYKIMVMVTTDTMGHGDDELGKRLMASFLTTLKEMGNQLWRLVFVNNGVKLTVDGSGVLPVLKELEAQGTYILVCGTCLTHFNLLERKQVGETTNMLDIVTALQLADKVINI